MNTHRIIKSQGELDSACFLYSLVNALQSLSGEELKGVESKWKKLISGVYDCRDFLTGNEGTNRIDHLQGLILALVSDYLKMLNPKKEYSLELLKRINNIQDLRKILTKDSLLMIDNGEHWFCLLDIDRNYAYIACSFVLQQDPSNYKEDKTPRLNRTYNDKFPVNELKEIDGCIILVSA